MGVGAAEVSAQGAKSRRRTLRGHFVAELKKKAAEAAANAVVRLVVLVLTPVIVPYVTTFIPAFRDYMSDSVFVPRWAILSVILGVAGSGALVSLQIRAKIRDAAALRAEIQRRDERVATFRWGGVDWPLTLNFWGTVAHTSAGRFERGEADASLLHASIGDPLCPRCHYEIWPTAILGKCGNCPATFQLGLSGLQILSDEVRFGLKLDVYRAARAQYWQNQTGGLSGKLNAEV